MVDHPREICRLPLYKHGGGLLFELARGWKLEDADASFISPVTTPAYAVACSGTGVDGAGNDDDFCFQRTTGFSGRELHNVARLYFYQQQLFRLCLDGAVLQP